MTCADISEELQTVRVQRVTRKARSRLSRDCRRLAYMPNRGYVCSKADRFAQSTFDRSEYDFSSGEPTGDREHTS